MKKISFCIIILSAFFFIEVLTSSLKGSDETSGSDAVSADTYTYPDFYRGIYLNVASAKNLETLTSFVERAKNSYINTFVMDVQSSKYKKCIVPPENIKYCIDNGIHVIARIVVFPEGLKVFPVAQEVIAEKLEIAESACLSGFKEIQFDYIRFNDSEKLKYLKKEERYNFIEGFLARARTHLTKYNVKIAADIFGRIPLNSGDIIGQRMEGLDKVVDIICPMAYPSHYTWSKKLQNDPYLTVFMTSKRADERTQNAEIVTYIQAFQMKLGTIAYDKYLIEQIRAVHDSGIRGYLLWNARQDYDVPFSVTKNFYNNMKVSEKEKYRMDNGKS